MESQDSVIDDGERVTTSTTAMSARSLRAARKRDGHVIPQRTVKRRRQEDDALLLDEFKAAPFSTRGSDWFRRVISCQAAAHHIRQFITDDDAVALLRVENAAYRYATAFPYFLRRYFVAPARSVRAFLGPLRPTRLRIGHNHALSKQYTQLTSVTALDFQRPFRRALTSCEWPPFIRHVSLSRKYYQQIRPNALPKTVTSLTHEGNLHPRSVLPPQLTSLKINESFLPPSDVDILPPTLTELRVNYRDRLPHSFPTSLITLSLDCYNPNLTFDMFPASLTDLTIQTLPTGPPPPQLKRLTIGMYRAAPVMFPETLTALTLRGNVLMSTRFPQSLTRLSLLSTINSLVLDTIILPQSITQLEIVSLPDKPGFLPVNLTALTLRSDLVLPLPAGVIPNSVNELQVHTIFIREHEPTHDGTLFPTSLRKLKVFYAWEMPDCSLPISLTDLDVSTVSRRIDPQIPVGLPALLKTLRLPRDAYTCPINSKQELPPSLTQIFLSRTSPWKEKLSEFGDFALIYYNE